METEVLEIPTGSNKAAGSLTGRVTWLVAGKLIAFLLGFLTPLLVARRLDLVTVGTYKQVFMIIISATNVLPLGFATCAYYFLPTERTRQNEVVLNIVLVLTAIGIATACVAFFLPQSLVWLVGDPNITKYASYIAMIIPLAVLGQGFETILMANQEVQLAAVFTVSMQASRTLALFIAVLVWATPEAIVIGYVLHSVASIAAMWLYLNSRFPALWRNFDGELLKQQFAYALPFGAIAMLWTLQVEMHAFFVSKLFGAAALAIYTNGCFHLPVMGLIVESSTSVILPQLSTMRKLNQDKEILALIARVTRKLAVASIALYCFLATVSEPLMVFLLTDKFRESAPIFFVNSTLILAAMLPIDPLTRVYPEYRFFFVRFRIVLVAFMALALWYFTPKFGPIGAITVFITTALFDKLFTAGAFIRFLRMNRTDLLQFRDVLKIAGCGVIAAIGSIAARHQTVGSKPLYVLLASGVVFTTLYVTMLFICKVPNIDERNLIRRVVQGPLKQLFA